MLKKFWNDESGQGMVEYALIIALIAIVAITVLTKLGTGVSNKLEEASSALAD